MSRAALVVVTATGFGLGIGLGLTGCGMFTTQLSDGSKTVNPDTCHLAVELASDEVERCDDISKGDDSEEAQRNRGFCRTGAAVALMGARSACNAAKAKVEADRRAAEAEAETETDAND